VKQESVDDADSEALCDWHHSPQPAQAGAEAGNHTLSYISASDIAAELELSPTKRGRQWKHGGTTQVIRQGTRQPVPGEGILCLEQAQPTVALAPKPKPTSKAKQEKKPKTQSKAPRSSDAPPSPDRLSKPAPAPARRKPRHSGDPVVVQNTRLSRPRVFVPLRVGLPQYSSPLRLPPISAPQPGPLPPISFLTGAFKYSPRRNPMLTRSPPLPPALHVSSLIDAGDTCHKPSRGPSSSTVDDVRADTKLLSAPLYPQTIPPADRNPSMPSRPTGHVDGHVNSGSSAVQTNLPVFNVAHYSRNIAAFSLATPATEYSELRWHVHKAHWSRTSVRWHPYHTPRLGCYRGKVDL